MRLSLARVDALFVICAVFVLATLVPPVYGEETSLGDIAVTTGLEHLEVDFEVRNCFTEDIKEAIHSGIPASFTFFIELNRVRGFWWDEGVADIRVSHHIQYDNLKKFYSVRRSERDEEPISVESFREAKELMSTISGLKVTELENLTKGSRYQIRMMAELDKIRLPFYLHHVLFFLSLWDFETDWYAVDFKY